jgi:hypothetical protein
MVLSLYLEHATLRPLLMEVRLWSILKEALLESHASIILCLGEKMKWCLKEVANEVLLGGFDALKVHLEQHDILRENRAVGSTIVLGTQTSAITRGSTFSACDSSGERKNTPCF